jgi:hypothetical protein
MSKSKSIMMVGRRKRLNDAGLVSFSGYCYPSTKEKIKEMERIDREDAGVNNKGECPTRGKKRHE